MLMVPEGDKDETGPELATGLPLVAHKEPAPAATFPRDPFGTVGCTGTIKAGEEAGNEG